LQLDQLQVARLRLWEHILQLIATQAPDASQQAAIHIPIIVEHLVIAILQQVLLRYRYLFAGDAAAIDLAAQHPVHGAVAMIGAAIAVFAEGTTTVLFHSLPSAAA